MFNNSTLKLTEDMENVLNRGLKFAITPLKLDITQVLTEFRRFERTMVWKEFWFGQENEGPYEPPIFKQKKSNFPHNYRSPRGLQDYLAAIKSEIMDPKNRIKVTSNLPTGEIEALKMLIQLQKNMEIVIKPCDKGAGIIILDFKEYMKACINHLTSKTVTGENYYKQVDNTVIEEGTTKITNLVNEAYDNEIITKEEYCAMLPSDDTVPGRFYGLFKVHKEYEEGRAPPIRGIVSTSGSFSENIAI